MSSRDRVVSIANDEIDKYGVTWVTHEHHILEYFLVATGRSWTKKEAIKISWCTYFAHWVVKRAGVLPLPKVGTTNPTARFMKKRYGGAYKEHLIDGGYRPKPGDLYFRAEHQHIGIITGVNSDRSLITVDGNGGTSGFDPRFDMTYGNQIGKGFISRGKTTRLKNETDLFLEIPG